MGETECEPRLPEIGSPGNARLEAMMAFSRPKTD